MVFEELDCVDTVASFNLKFDNEAISEELIGLNEKVDRDD